MLVTLNIELDVLAKEFQSQEQITVPFCSMKGIEFDILAFCLCWKIVIFSQTRSKTGLLVSCELVGLSLCSVIYYKPKSHRINGKLRHRLLLH